MEDLGWSEGWQVSRNIYDGSNLHLIQTKFFLVYKLSDGH